MVRVGVWMLMIAARPYIPHIRIADWWLGVLMMVCDNNSNNNNNNTNSNKNYCTEPFQ